MSYICRLQKNGILDSLTQITLGAAIGEAVAGKKLGNKAMLIGGFAGTIPDLDVITNLWMNDIEAMSFHRGFSHSIFFAIIFPLIFAFATQWYYKQKLHTRKSYHQFWRGIWLLLGFGLICGFTYLMFSTFNFITCAAFLVFGTLGSFWVWRSRKYSFDDFEFLSFRHWYLFYFLAFATHIMIDAFTTYGTQIFQPFSNYRFTTSSVSVVDPLYTIPFLICLILASFYNRKRLARFRWNWAGLIISTLYMIFTFFNKAYIENQFEDRLESLNIVSAHKMTNPTIFNNVLWHGIVELDTAYLESYYSLFDTKSPFEDIRIIPKNRDLLINSGCENSENIKTLRWFSDDYYNFSTTQDTTYYNDLRFGTIWMDDLDKPDKQVFYFRLDEQCDAHEMRDTDGIGDAFNLLWERIKGE